MSKVKERKHGVEPDRPTTVEDHELPPLETIERPAEFTPAATAPTPSKFIRWIGWLLGALALVGIGAMVWWAAFSSNPAEMTDLEAWHRTEVASATVSNHTNLETWHRQEVARTVAPLTAPAEIDPRVSPEILRAFPVTDVSSWSLESLYLLRSLPTQGIDELSLESLQLLRSLPVMIPAEIDPHESPEISRINR